jgi:phospholipid/cholesterol/gamma-HCH transport system permease protein
MTAPVTGRGWRATVDGATTSLALTTDWTTHGIGIETGQADRLLGRVGMTTIGFETSRLGRWDSALLVFLSGLRQASVERNIHFDDTGLPEAARRLLALLPDRVSPAAVPIARPGLFERVGLAVIAEGAELGAVVSLVGQATLRTGAALYGKSRMRGVDLIACMWDAGIGALPIVTVVNVLVGGILAFVGAVQLRRFGADIYIANLVGVAVIREMAALMTAIVMSGRTGAAYAAEIATMQGTEEIDALRAIGIPVQDYLVLPRVSALTSMMPLLYLYGSAAGILGGFAVSVAMLNISRETFIAQTRGAVAGSQVLFGLAKSIAFGALIAIAACRIGMKAGRSSSDVGHAATNAAVTGIVGVIVLDAVFAVCANALGI